MNISIKHIHQRTDLWFPGVCVEDWEFGISRNKLLNIGWLNNKVLLYSTGDYIQYLPINHKGKECEERIYIYI